MEGERFHYEASLAPDGRVRALMEWLPHGLSRTIPPDATEGLDILGAGRDILYRFDEERRLRNLPYPEVLEAMRQEIRLTLHKVMHGELLDEPEVAPSLRRLLLDIDTAATAFRQAWVDRSAM